MSKKILVIDDDALMRRSLSFNLEQVGYKVESAATAEDGLAVVARERPDLILLDIGLPGMDGLDALREFKENYDLPVIFLTARRRNLDEVVGLELGADDYVTKPFDFDVLHAHIKAVLRRVVRDVDITKPSVPIVVGDIVIDPLEHSVTVNGEKVELTPREFDLLHTMALHPNKVLSVDELLSQVWGAEFAGQPQVVYVHIRWLREKIESDPNQPERILTVPRVGYKLAVLEK
jgi:DNA-binding response OmpR family regulator